MEELSGSQVNHCDMYENAVSILSAAKLVDIRYLNEDVISSLMIDYTGYSDNIIVPKFRDLVEHYAIEMVKAKHSHAWWAVRTYAQIIGRDPVVLASFLDLTEGLDIGDCVTVKQVVFQQCRRLYNHTESDVLEIVTDKINKHILILIEEKLKMVGQCDAKIDAAIQSGIETLLYLKDPRVSYAINKMPKSIYMKRSINRFIRECQSYFDDHKDVGHIIFLDRLIIND